MRARCLGARARARALGGAAVMAMAAVAVAGFPADAAPSGPAAGSCAVPVRVSVVPVGASTVRLVWRLPAAQRGASVRVWRSGGVVGQTRARSMIVRLHPGRRVTLAAGIVGPHGGAPRCRARVRALAGSRGGGSLPPPAGLTGGRITARRVQLTWRPVPGARGYRVLRDGVVLSQVPRPKFAVTLKAKKHTYKFSIASVDLTGKPGPFSRAVALTPGHRPPAVPRRPVLTAASDNSLEVMWKPVAAGSSPVRAYRVLRDGLIVGQVAKASITLTRLYPDRTYRIQVAAIDKHGYLSKSSPVLLARTATPVQSTGHVRLFLLASTDSSFEAFQRVYQHVGTIYPTYYDCQTTTGATLGKDDPRITRWAMARGVKVQPRYNCQSPGMVHKLVSDPARRAALIASLTGLVDVNGYDGINLDLEQGTPADRDNLSILTAELAAALHARGRRLSVDVSPKFADVLNHPRSSFYDYNALALNADEILVMSWGLHWSTSAPGSSIDISWYTQVYDYVATLPSHGKFVMGAPLYGFDWPAGGGPTHVATALGWPALQVLIAQTGAVPIFDAPTDEWHFTYTDPTGVPHEVWFSTAETLNAHLSLAAPRGLAGIVLWRAGQEDPALWDAPSVRAME
jgi:spore germination protein YaaH